MKVHNKLFAEVFWHFLPAACDAKVKACFESKDHVEGRQAYFEKRKANFVGA